MADRLVSSPETFLMPIARRKNAGVIAMKVLGHGEFPNKELALRYSLNVEGVSMAIIGMESQAHIDGILEMAADAKPLSDVEMERLIGTVRPLVEEDSKAAQGEAGKEQRPKLFWLHDTKVMGWKQRDEPALVTY
jgi:predicted aldo/keto reductase-like oxidoreductase